jgi:hypothetical protein
MKESSWNNVIWLAMENIKHFNIDEIFRDCEKKFYSLQAPEKEIGLRLFALALYCNKTYNSYFLRSAIFPRFAEIFEFFHFELAVKKLIKKNDPALVIFWAIFRLSSGYFVPRGNYLPLEKEMRRKSLEMATGNFYITH